jgi:hypothetical protein
VRRCDERISSRDLSSLFADIVIGVFVVVTEGDKTLDVKSR